MKKSYKKPDIIFDSFELATSIAAGCQLISTNNNPYVCPVLDKEWDLTIFLELGICDMTPQDYDGKICYDVPMADPNVYVS